MDCTTLDIGSRHPKGKREKNQPFHFYYGHTPAKREKKVLEEMADQPEKTWYAGKE